MSDEFVLPRIGGLYLRDALQGTITDADDSARTVQVKFPHDTVDTYKTTFEPSAFVDSFARRFPLMCWQHDMRDPIGHAIHAQATRSANELTGQFSDFDAVPNAKRAYSQIKDKTITDFSFGFRHPRFVKHKRYPGVRAITHAQMMEFSPVSIGSIPGAVVTGLREEDLMEAHTIEEIRGLVEAEIITPEQGKAMLAKMDEGFREIFAIGGAGGSDTGRVEHALVGGGGVEDEELQFRSDDVEVPGELTAQHIVDALPDSWRAALDGATLHVIPDGQEVLVREAGTADAVEAGGQIAQAIDAACQQADEWLRDVKVEELPEGAQSAITLYRAAGTSADALLEILAPESRAEPTSPTGAENMEPHKVTCLACGGTGAVENGAICPECGGSGIQTITRADMPQDAPDDAKPCPTCHGKGTMLKGNMKCKTCKGKGWLTPDQAEDHGKRSDVSSWSDTPWSDFTPAKYDPDQWKRACLVVTGDGSTKADCHLPVKEPDGTYNKNGIRAAASRISGASSLSAEEKTSAANTIADLYRQMGEDVPPDVSKLSTRTDEEGGEVRADDLDAQAVAALARLDRHRKPIAAE